jgi:hypothetical protein
MTWLRSGNFHSVLYTLVLSNLTAAHGSDSVIYSVSVPISELISHPLCSLPRPKMGTKALVTEKVTPVNLTHLNEKDKLSDGVLTPIDDHQVDEIDPAEERAFVRRLCSHSNKSDSFYRSGDSTYFSSQLASWVMHSSILTRPT